MEDKDNVDYDFGSAFGSIKKVVEAAGDDGSDIGGQNNSNEWKQDIGERSHCIYEWWRTIMNERSGFVPFFEEEVVKGLLLLFKNPVQL